MNYRSRALENINVYESINYYTVVKMRLVKQDKDINVKNFDFTQNIIQKIRHSSLLPNSIRALIVGPSNCGKTNAMISLVESPNGLKFENIYIYSKSLHQPKYQYLRELITPIKGMGFYTYSENTDVLPPDKAKKNSVMIFDDVACEKQNNIRTYFCMGRHRNIDSFYLCQTYTRIPKHLIRDNANLIVIFKQDGINMKHIFNEHVGSDMSYNTFVDICQECWKDKYGFLVICKDNEIAKGRYRKGFDVFICV